MDATSTPVTLRPFRRGDLAAVNALKAAVVRDVFSAFAPAVKRGLALNPRGPHEDHAFWRGCVVATANQGIVGVARNGGTWLTDLWIAETWQRRGLGRRLLMAAETAMRRAGARVVRLRTPLANSPAIAFYRGRGWRIERLILHKKRIDFGVVFIKRL